MTTNPRSRIITVERLLNTGRLEWTGTPIELSADAVLVEGKLYSSKPVTQSLILAGIALMVRTATGVPISKDTVDGYSQLLALFSQVLPWFLMLLLADDLARRHHAGNGPRIFLMLALTLGCLPFGYTSVINNHSPVAALLVCALWIHTVLPENRWKFALMGLILGTMAAFELTSAMFGLAFGMYYMFTLRKKSYLTILAAAAILPLLPNAWVNYSLTGDIMPFQFKETYFMHENSFLWDPKAHDDLHDSLPAYAFHSLIGFRGLFLLSPLLLLIIPQAEMAVRGINQLVRPGLFLMLFLSSVFLILFIIFFTTNYGGYAIGMRWFFCFIPLWTLLAYPSIVHAWQKPWLRGLLVLLLIVSVPATVEAWWNEGFIIGMHEKLIRPGITDVQP